MAEDEQVVKITLREIYDTVVRTHEAVQAYGPRLDAVEKVAEVARKTADSAQDISQGNARHISAMWKAVVTIAGGAIIALINAWAYHHIF